MPRKAQGEGRKARAKRKRRGPVVRVVAPPAETAAGRDAGRSRAVAGADRGARARRATGGGGGGAAKPKRAGPTLWAGEG